MPISEENIRKELDLSPGEEQLLAGAETGHPSDVNKTRIFADIYMAKKLSRAIDGLVESNERLAKSNDRNAKALNWFTFGIFFVAAVQLVIGIFFK